MIVDASLLKTYTNKPRISGGLLSAFTAWIETHVTIEDVQGANAIIPFCLWPAQQEALRAIVASPQVVILKARQLGVSWLVIVYAVWLCLFFDNKTVLIFSKDQDAANEMVRRARGIYARLKHKPVTLIMDNVATLGWSNGSRLKSFAATRDAGSAFTATLTILDEYAKMQYPDDLYTAVKPTVGDGGQMIIISTARGVGNPFHRLWDDAVKGLNTFRAIFLPWWARPGRDDAWYSRMELDAASTAHHKQEYPAEPAESFQTVGDERFLPSMLLWDACREVLPPLTANEPIVIALDAGVSNDSFGLVGVTAHPTKPGICAVRLVHEWKPPKGGTIDFYGSADAPGPDWLIRNVLTKNYDVVQIVYDPYQLHSLCSRLIGDGVVWCEPFNQTTDRLEADKNLLDAILSRRIIHDGNAALWEHLDNSNRRVDQDGHKLRLEKRTGQGKIDLAVCLSTSLLTCWRLGLGRS